MIRVSFFSIVLFIVLVSCAKRHYPENVKYAASNYDTTLNFSLNYDTLPVELFHNTFYKLLKKISPDNSASVFIYNDEIAYLFNHDTLMISPTINSKALNFFRYNKSNFNKVLLIASVKLSENNLLVFMEKNDRQNINLKEYPKQMNVEYSHTMLPLEKIISQKKNKGHNDKHRNQEKNLTFVFKKIEGKYIVTLLD